MSPTDWIQMITAAIFGITLVAILLQLRSQNRMFMGQMLKDRFDMYWKTVEPVSDAAVKQLTLCPEDYMDRDFYEKHYKGDPDAIRKYIYILEIYEYLAFTYGLKRYELPDPLGYEWTEMWTKDLLAEREFIEVHQYHKRYYPYFAAYVDGLSRKPTR
jgi:hypothetical protein